MVSYFIGMPQLVKKSKNIAIPLKGKPCILILHVPGEDMVLTRSALACHIIMENTCGQHYVTLTRKVLKQHLLAILCVFTDLAIWAGSV